MTNTVDTLTAYYVAMSYAVNASPAQAAAAHTYAPADMHRVSATRDELTAAAERYCRAARRV